MEKLSRRRRLGVQKRQTTPVRDTREEKEQQDRRHVFHQGPCAQSHAPPVVLRCADERLPSTEALDGRGGDVHGAVRVYHLRARQRHDRRGQGPHHRRELRVRRIRGEVQGGGVETL